MRIAQLEMLAILLAIRSLGHVLRDSYCRIHVDNVAAMYSCLNGYSGNPYMARLAGEIWMELPPSQKKPVQKVAGKHPLNGAPQAKKNFEPR